VILESLHHELLVREIPKKIRAISRIRGFRHWGFERERSERGKLVKPFSAFRDLSVREARSRETWSPDSRYRKILKAFRGIAPIFDISTFRGSGSRGGSGLGRCISNSRLLKSRYSQDSWVEGELYFLFGEKEVKTHAWCTLCRWGFFEGPVDQIRGVPVRARKNYFSSMDPKKMIL
jgi:hypothetical protein